MKHLHSIYETEAPVIYREYMNLGNDWNFYQDVQDVPVVTFENPLEEGVMISVACMSHPAVDATHASLHFDEESPLSEAQACMCFKPLLFRSEPDNVCWKSPSFLSNWPFTSIQLEAPVKAVIKGSIMTVEGEWVETAFPLGIAVQYGYFRWLYKDVDHPSISFCTPRPTHVGEMPMATYLELEDHFDVTAPKRTGYWDWQLELGDYKVNYR